MFTARVLIDEEWRAWYRRAQRILEVKRFDEPDDAELVDEHQVRELFRASGGWMSLAKLFEYCELPRAGAFCRRRSFAVETRARAALHRAMTQ